MVKAVKSRNAALSALATLLLLPSAAATAAAQVRTVSAVEGSSVRAIPGVGMAAGQGYLPTTSPLMSLSPSLSAPAVSPDLSDIVLPILHAPSVVVAVQNPSPLPSALRPVARIAAAPSKSDDVRSEIAKAIAEWKASRSLPKSEQTPASPSAGENQPHPSVELDALFDGSLPASREVLARAESLGLHDAALALAISESKSPSDAAARLSALGVLGAKESGLAQSNEAEFRFLLTRLWRKTSPSIPGPFTVDDSFDIPALKVVRDGVVYYVHGVAHGQIGAPRRSAILSLTRKVAAAGHALYSEQNLPAYYGYNSGFETLDHAIGAPAAVVPAAPGYTRASLLVKRAIDWAVSPGSALGALVWALVAPAAPLAWFVLACLTVLAGYTLTGGLPMMRWKRRRLAAGAREQGLEDIAEQYADEAKNFFVAKPDLEILRGLELPQPMGAQSSDPYSVRSRAIADAVAADAAKRGAKTVHLVVGHLHAHETAWRLAEDPQTT